MADIWGDTNTRKLLLAAQSAERGYKFMCAGCGNKLPPHYAEIDHVIPLKKGGSDDITNKLLLCSPCNKKKSAELSYEELWEINEAENKMISKRDAQRAFCQGQKATQQAVAYPNDPCIQYHRKTPIKASGWLDEGVGDPLL